MWEPGVEDPDLFDDSALGGNDGHDPQLRDFKQVLAHGRQQLAEAFSMGTPIKTLVYKQAWLIDRILQQAWDLHALNHAKLALVAVGGYGRGELHPGSDVDLMILCPPRMTAPVNEQLQKFLTFLWDIGLEVGHSVRTVRDSVREAKKDITVATNIMESRLLAGDSVLYEAMRAATGPNRIWPPRKFFQAKWQEQIARHRKYDDSGHNLEPNIKEAPGDCVIYK
jgi:[protein-PII] uridylyltransferase